MKLQISGVIDKNSFERNLLERINSSLENMNKVPVSVLLWGPNPLAASKTGNCRMKLKKVLEELGHVCYYSEELLDKKKKHSLLAQQAAQIENFDLVFSIPDSPGSIAEIHDFSLIPSLSQKIITYLDNKWNDGYSNTTLIQRESLHSPKVHIYNEDELPHGIIKLAVGEVQRLQELYYMLGVRRL